MTAAPQTRPAPRRPVDDTLQRPEFAFPVALALYFLLHLLIRISLSDSLELDEAEAVFHSQRLALGYGPQPPLYDWLQWIFISGFGLELFSLALLKNLLLLATYLCTWFLARPLIGVYAATAASMSLVLFPQIGWESQRDLTHSVLVTCLASATLWCYFALLRKPVFGRFALLGLLVGLGSIAKYSFVIFVAGLAVSSWLVREHRAIVWNRKLLLSIAVALAVVLPHGLWLLQNVETVAAGTLRKMAEGTRVDGYFRNVVGGVLSLAGAIFAFTWLAVLVHALASRPWWKRIEFRPRTPHARFFLCLYASFLALLLLIVLSGEVGRVKDRWLQPLLFSLPVALFVLLPLLPARPLLARIAKGCVVMALAVLLLIPLRVLLGPMLGKHVRQHLPFPELAADLAQRFPQVQTVVTDGTLLAGNLYFQHPAWRTLLLKDVSAGKEHPVGEILVVMPEDEELDESRRLRTVFPQARTLQQGRLTLSYRFGGRASASYRYSLVDPGLR